MHNEYGYGKEFRDQVLRDADTYGIATAAAKHRVSKSSIYSWRKKQIEQESWLDICARHITIYTALQVLAVFVGIIAVAHAIASF